MAIPQCRRCHDRYEAEALWIPDDEFMAIAALHLVRAYWEGHFRWTNL